jgi:hypothetical protein
MIAATAVLQWSIVLERVWAAALAWYKFVDYGGGGQIVVGRMLQIVFLVGSITLAGIGHALSKAESSAGGSVFWRRLAQFGWSAVSICVMVWIALLPSPLVTFQGGLTPLTH